MKSLTLNKSRKIKILIIAFLLLEIALMLILWRLNIQSFTHWKKIKEHEALEETMKNLDWDFWNYIWNSGKIMSTQGNISKLTNYQNKNLPNLIAGLFTNESIGDSNDNEGLIKNFYHFNLNIQASVAILTILGIVLLIIVWLSSLIFLDYLIKNNTKISFIKKIRHLQNNYESWQISNISTKDLIEVKNLCFRTNDSNHILKNINLNIKKGSFNIIIGPNGSGKTTFLKNLINLQTHTSGEILWDGQEVSKINKTEFARQISYIPQFLNLKNPVSVVDFLEFARYPYRQLHNNDEKIDFIKTMRAIELNNCGEFKNKMINELSGGQKQRVILTNVLVQESKVIVLDEPTSYLDVKNQYQFLEMISNFHKQGKTIIMILHDIVQAINYADNLIVMMNGKVQISGHPKKIINKDLIREIFKIDCDILETNKGIRIENINAI